MRGLSRFFGKELQEIGRTWRLFVLPGMMLLLALSGPVLAKLTPELISSMTQSQPGVVIKVPEPTYVDAYAQWIKNLSQLIVFALLIVSGGLIAGERASGTAILVLTKPVSRGGFVVAKFFAQTLLVVAATALCTLATWGVTVAVFGDAPPELLVKATAVWLAFAVLLVAAMTLFSAAFSTLAAAGCGVGLYIALSIATVWGPAVRYSPAGLVGAPVRFLTHEGVELLWPMTASAVATVLLVAAAVGVFARKEL